MRKNYMNYIEQYRCVENLLKFKGVETKHAL